MPPYLSVLAEVTHHLALVPVLWLVILAYYGQPRAVEWWGLAATLELFWLADTAAHHYDPWTVSALYPLGQAVLMALLLLSLRDALRLGGFVVAVGLGIVVLRGIARPELIAHTVAWVSILCMVWPPQTMFARAVLGVFGVCWFGWYLFTVLPTLVGWSFFQGERLGGTLVFCWASWAVRPARVLA